MTTRLKRSQRLKGAIRRLRAKIQATSRTTQPKEWATIHLLLSDKYNDLERGQGQARWNLRQAQFHIQKAERVFTRRQYPEEWATVHALYGHLISRYPWLGKVRRRLLAIQHQQLALQVFTRKADPPAMWAELQNNISDDYGVLFNLRRRPEDLQRCYRHLRNALAVYRQMRNSHIRRVVGNSHIHRVERRFAATSRILKSRYFKKLMENRRRSK